MKMQRALHKRVVAAVVAVAALAFPFVAAATLTITPITWNVVGLESNSPTTGPQNFPVGARVCSTVSTTANGEPRLGFRKCEH